MRIDAMLCTTNTIEALRFLRDSIRKPAVNPAGLHVSATELFPRPPVVAQMKPGAQREPAS
jgi:hypothetical protein